MQCYQGSLALSRRTKGTDTSDPRDRCLGCATLPGSPANSMACCTLLQGNVSNLAQDLPQAWPPHLCAGPAYCLQEANKVAAKLPWLSSYGHGSRV